MILFQMFFLFFYHNILKYYHKLFYLPFISFNKPFNCSRCNESITRIHKIQKRAMSLQNAFIHCIINTFICFTYPIRYPIFIIFLLTSNVPSVLPPSIIIYSIVIITFDLITELNCSFYSA